MEYVCWFVASRVDPSDATLAGEPDDG